MLEKQPGGAGFFFPAKRRTSSFSDKRIIPKCREKEPEDLGFICPALRTKVSAPVCFSRPPRTRRKPRCDHIWDPLRDGTSFAAPTDSRVLRTPESDAESVSVQGRVRECSPPTPYLVDLLCGEGSPETVSPEMHPSSVRLPKSP